MESEDIMAIFITGDTHGNFRRFESSIFYEQSKLTKKDCMIICGDFGGVWDGGPEEQRQLDWLEQKPYTTLFVSGNHENYDLLAKYPVEEWSGGQVQRICPTVIHLMRGQVYDIQGKKFFTMGGASSHDIDGGILEPDDPQLEEKQKKLENSQALYRINHESWWKEELPSEEEYEVAWANLEKCDWKVDYIITHCCSTSVQDELSGGFYKSDTLTDFLDEVTQRCQFEYHFFGHYHTNKIIQDKFVLLYEQIIRIH